MKIGEHEVTNITRDKVKVGCQEVTRADIEAVLKQMDTAPKKPLFKVTNGRSTGLGSVWLEEQPGGIVVLVYNGFILLELSHQGFSRISYCKSTGLPTEDANGRRDVVKMS